MAGEGIIIGISKTNERLQYFDFSEALSEDNVWLVTRCDKIFPFKTLDDLKGKTIGVVRGVSAGEEFDGQANRLFKIDDDTDVTEARFIKLYNGRADALIYLKTANSTSSELARELNQRYLPVEAKISAASPTFCVLDNPVVSVSVHIAQRKGLDQSPLQRINKAIISGKQNGKLKRVTASK
ncbi:substrate-binding periplasmic protein [Sapientia aquatica]|uniref:Transporter substrate-binding domain-containing protein n=1 Tax=Sapientia aquatica TaxID=1549640 RepID=A0A4R5VY37_9BURK|nr:transporter substrate-binding domain-containing protein [Sapientia aquatica]TDK64409.1 transporter substrate-binding domain-containing protein [Sapientia aquatica]